MFHAHQDAVQESLLFRGLPHQLGLGRPPFSPFLNQELGGEPLGLDVAPYYAKSLGQLYQFPSAGIPWLLRRLGLHLSFRSPGWARMSYHPLTTQAEGYGSNAGLCALLLSKCVADKADARGPKLICSAKWRRAVVEGKVVDNAALVSCVEHRFWKTRSSLSSTWRECSSPSALSKRRSSNSTTYGS